MVVIKGQANNLVFTLSEKQTIENANFLFEFKNEMELRTKTCIMQDISVAKERYNEFILTETTTEILTSGHIELSPQGMWTYKVFEQVSDSNLDVNLLDNKTPIEVGVIRVIGDSVDVKTFNGNETNFKVYEL
jgi:hypothetical protein